MSTTTTLGLAVTHITNATQQIERAERDLGDAFNGAPIPEEWTKALADARMALENITGAVLAAYEASGEQDEATRREIAKGA